MSDDRNTPPASADADFLLKTLEIVAEGRSTYGPIGSPRQVAKEAELRAQLEFGRRIGEIAPAPEPMSADKIAKDRLASEWRFGEPSATFPEYTATANKQRFDSLAALDDRRLASLTDELAADLAERPSPVCANYCGFRPELGRKASGHEIIEGLAKDAALAIAANHPDPADRQRVTKFIRSNRQLLELYAQRGQAVAAFNAQKKRFGL